jgi:hypothetical protein
MNDVTTFRPRNGLSAECYWRVRSWCETNGFTLSDVLNAIIIPLAYYLENFSTLHREQNKATVELNIGPVDILRVWNGKCYPLRSATKGADLTLSLEEIQEKVAYWKERNKTNPQYTDLLLLNSRNYDT